MTGCVIIGATGQCKVIADVLERAQLGFVCAIIDEKEDITNPLPSWCCQFYSGRNAFKNFLRDLKNKKIYQPENFVVAIGNPLGQRRREIYEWMMKETKLQPFSIIDPSAIISQNAHIGKGAQIHQGAIVQTFAKVGDFCILNTGCQVDHDCVLADGVEIGPGAVVCGTTLIGENSWIGAGSVVRHCQKIGKNVIVGCGSVVVDDLEDGCVYVGNPARFLKRNENVV